jgi:hypothetical protein
MSDSRRDRRPLTRDELSATRALLPAGNPLEAAIASLGKGGGFKIPAPAAPVATPVVASLPQVIPPAPPRIPQPSPALASQSTPEASPAAVNATGVFGAVGRAIGDVAGRVVGTVNRRMRRIFTPKMRQADVKVKGWTLPPPEHLVRDMVADFKKNRVLGVDISVVYFTQLVEKAVEKLAKDGRGFWQRSFLAMGTLANMSRETARKGIRWMRLRGWLGVLNGLYREDADPSRQEDRRDKCEANIYMILGKKAVAEIAATPPEARAAKWEDLTLARGAVLFGLYARDGGLNASPSRRHPTPA